MYNSAGWNLGRNTLAGGIWVPRRRRKPRHSGTEWAEYDGAPRQENATLGLDWQIRIH